MLRVALASVAICLALPPLTAAPLPLTPEDEAQLRKDANNCACVLYQIGQVQSNFFPDGVEKAINGTNVRGVWPPGVRYSWRVATLPFMEQAILYEHLQKHSNGFRLSPTLAGVELEKNPEFETALGRMPDWFALTKSQRTEAKTSYRRVRIDVAPQLFVIASGDPVPWAAAGDDLTISGGRPLPAWGGRFPNGFLALCGDRRVRYLPSRLGREEVVAALTAGKGVPVIRWEDEGREADVAGIRFR